MKIFSIPLTMQYPSSRFQGSVGAGGASRVWHLEDPTMTGTVNSRVSLLTVRETCSKRRGSGVVP